MDIRNQFLQGKEKSTLGTNLKPLVDTCTLTLTFTLGSNQKPFDQKPFTNSCKKHNIDLPFKDTHKKGGITTTLTMTPKTVNMVTTRILMSVESQDSISSKPAQLGESTLQEKQITRPEGNINIDQLYDRENLLTDLPVSWPYKELLPSETGFINCGNWIIKAICQYVHREFYILPRPSKAMTQEKFQYMRKVPIEQKEVYILSRPMLPDCGTPPLQPMANYSIALPLQLITQRTPREKDLPQLPSTLGAQEMHQT